jgi:acetate kinase
VVHGGPRYAKPQIVTPAMIEELRRLGPFAPEHLPAQTTLISAMAERFRAVP